MRYIFLSVLFAATLAGGNAMAAGNPGAFAGNWTITAAKTAPWADPAHPVADDGERAALLNGGVVITAKKITGPKQVACSDPHYGIKTYTPDMLFQGGLKTPATDAPALGFKSNAIKVLETGCENEIDWQMADDGSLEFGLNDYVYVLTKKAK
ncbi:MAG TPA: hypothetical protein VH000_13360 [Rhizomicrobium sp.]|nr:hypothetical protein [Rhizomicrobium sp.]